MQFVLQDARMEQTPCIHIPLSPAGERIASLYRSGARQELEDALRDWLRTTLRRLEMEKKKQDAAANLPIKQASRPQLR
jgi:hypothetical protein